MSYIEREAVNALIEAECSPKVAAFLNHAIDNIPAADVRPAVSGRWELSDETPYIRKHYHTVACSNCHRAGMKGWNYCPNCGAKMEES